MSAHAAEGLQWLLLALGICASFGACVAGVLLYRAFQDRKDRPVPFTVQKGRQLHRFR